MARHSNGENNFKVAGWIWAVAVIAILIIAGLILYFTGQDEDQAGTSAAESDATVAATTTDAAGESAGSGDEAASSETASATASESEEATSEASSTESEESAAASPSSATSAAAAEAEDTLLLFDTSDGMAATFGPVSNSLADTARALGESGQQVAVWNYSSPLTPGVVVGYRSNLGFGNGDEAANTVIRFGTGGVPQTRSAVVAAAATAADHARGTGSPARVLLVTTGTQQDMDDAAFLDAFKQAAGEDVQLSVVHVGGNEKDTALEEAASAFESVTDGSDSKALQSALKAVSGA